MSDSLPNLSIGDFAESLLNSNAIPPLHEAQDPSMPTVPGSNNQLDITNIDVPDDFMHEVLGGESTTSYLNSVLEGASPQPSIPRSEELPVREKVVDQTERLAALLEQLTAVLSETKQLISEMNTVGGVGGVNMAGPALAPKRRKPKRNRNRRQSVAETVASVLKEIQDGRS